MHELHIQPPRSPLAGQLRWQGTSRSSPNSAPEYRHPAFSDAIPLATLSPCPVSRMPLVGAGGRGGGHCGSSEPSGDDGTFLRNYLVYLVDRTNDQQSVARVLWDRQSHPLGSAPRNVFLPLIASLHSILMSRPTKPINFCKEEINPDRTFETAIIPSNLPNCPGKLWGLPIFGSTIVRPQG